MRDGNWWTFWELQETIKDKTGRFYGEPSLSAAIRDLRKPPFRAKYGINPTMPEVVTKRRIQDRKGYEYKLIGLNYE